MLYYNFIALIKQTNITITNIIHKNLKIKATNTFHSTTEQTMQIKIK